MVIRYAGGKARLAAWIADHLPPPGSYAAFVDVFGGAANVLLEVMRRHAAAGIDVLFVYNDADQELVNFFRVIREPEMRRELLALLRWTPYSRQQFQECLEVPPPDDPVRRAWRFFTVTQQSFSGVPARPGQAGRWAYDIAAPTGVRRWLNAQARLERFGEAFRRVQIECLDFAEVLRRYAAPGVLVYCDPPYPHETRTDNAMYRVEMPAVRHRELAERLAAYPGMAAVSGYRCPNYDAWFADWERYDRDATCSMSHIGSTRGTKGHVKPRRVESLWLNPAAVRARRNSLRQTSLVDLAEFTPQGAG